MAPTANLSLLVAALGIATAGAASVRRQEGPVPYQPPPSAPEGDTLCGVACTMDYRPVCGTDGITYANQCVFDSAVQCIPEAANVTVAYEGQCGCAPVSNLVASTSVIPGGSGTQPQEVSVSWDDFKGAESFQVCIVANERTGGVATTCTDIDNGTATSYSTVLPGDWSVTSVTVNSNGPADCEANEASTETIGTGAPATCPNAAPEWWAPFAQPEVLISDTGKSLEVRVTWLPNAPPSSLTADEYTQALNDIKQLVDANDFWLAGAQALELADKLDNPDNLNRATGLKTIAKWLSGAESPAQCQNVGVTVADTRNCLVDAATAEVDKLLADAPNLAVFGPLAFDGYEVCVVQEAKGSGDQYRQCGLYPVLPTVQKITVIPQSNTVSIWAEVRPVPSCLPAVESAGSISTMSYVPLKQIKPPSTSVDVPPGPPTPAGPPAGEPELLPTDVATSNTPAGPDVPPPAPAIPSVIPTDDGVTFSIAIRRRQGEPEDLVATATNTLTPDFPAATDDPVPFLPPPPGAPASETDTPTPAGPSGPEVTPAPEPIIRRAAYWCLYSAEAAGAAYRNVIGQECETGAGPEVMFYVEGGQYRTEDGMCLDTQDGDTAEGAFVVLAPCSVKSATQKWTYTDDGNIQSDAAAGLCVASAKDMDGFAALAPCGTKWNFVWYWDTDNAEPATTEGGLPLTYSVPNNALTVPELPPPVTIIPIPVTPVPTETTTTIFETLTPSEAPTAAETETVTSTVVTTTTIEGEVVTVTEIIIIVPTPVTEPPFPIPTDTATVTETETTTETVPPPPPPPAETSPGTEVVETATPTGTEGATDTPAEPAVTGESTLPPPPPVETNATTTEEVPVETVAETNATATTTGEEEVPVETVTASSSAEGEVETVTASSTAEGEVVSPTEEPASATATETETPVPAAAEEPDTTSTGTDTDTETATETSSATTTEGETATEETTTTTTTSTGEGQVETP